MSRLRPWVWILLAVLLAAIGLRWLYVETHRRMELSKDGLKPKFEFLFGERAGEEPITAEGTQRSRTPACTYRFVGGGSSGQILGARSTIEVKRLNGNVGLSAWMSVSLGDGYWIQAGYQEWGGPSPLVLCFHGGALGCPLAGQTNLATFPDISGSAYASFAIRNVGGTLWRVSINDLDVSQWDFGTTSATDASFATEEGYSCRTVRFPTLNLSPALELWNGQSWSIAPRAASIYGADWGIAGVMQDPTLAPGSVRIGTAIPAVVPGIQLW